LPVPEVDLTLSGATSATAMTDAAGNFGFTADGSDSTLRPSKQGGSNGAIDEQDAQYVLEFVAGLRQLDPDQRLAANVTGNPTVTALDAALILQFSKGQLSRFPIADQCGSDWIFRPDPSSDVGQMLTQPQTGGGGGCVMGAIKFPTTLTPPTAGQDFVAILFGDVNGNWSAQVATPPQEGTPPQPTPTCPPTIALEGLNR